MIVKIKKIIKIIFGTESNLLLKFNLSCFMTGFIFFLLALIFQASNMLQPAMIFTYISAILLAICLITIGNITSLYEIFSEIIRLATSFIVLTYSLNFCINQSTNTNVPNLIFYSVLSCIGILFCFFYLISKFIDILKAVKKIFIQFKRKLFDSVEPATTKAKALIENITAFLVAIAGLGLAIRTIIEPLINFIK